MAGASAGLLAGVRLSDHISLGVIARAFPPDQVRRVLSVDLPPSSGGDRSEYQAAFRMVIASMLARASTGVR
jgi:hypothetical protein